MPRGTTAPAPRCCRPTCQRFRRIAPIRSGKLATVAPWPIADARWTTARRCGTERRGSTEHGSTCTCSAPMTLPRCRRARRRRRSTLGRRRERSRNTRGGWITRWDRCSCTEHSWTGGTHLDAAERDVQCGDCRASCRARPCERIGSDHLRTRYGGRSCRASTELRAHVPSHRRGLRPPA